MRCSSVGVEEATELQNFEAVRQVSQELFILLYIHVDLFIYLFVSLFIC